MKDLTIIEGARENQLVGYGLVTGLAGTGDGKVTQTVQSIANALQRFGINVPAEADQVRQRCGGHGHGRHRAFIALRAAGSM